jgi:hypothetical protein
MSNFSHVLHTQALSRRVMQEFVKHVCFVFYTRPWAKALICHTLLYFTQFLHRRRVTQECVKNIQVWFYTHKHFAAEWRILFYTCRTRVYFFVQTSSWAKRRRSAPGAGWGPRSRPPESCFCIIPGHMCFIIFSYFCTCLDWGPCPDCNLWKAAKICPPPPQNVTSTLLGTGGGDKSNRPVYDRASKISWTKRVGSTSVSKSELWRNLSEPNLLA